MPLPYTFIYFLRNVCVGGGEDIDQHRGYEAQVRVKDLGMMLEEIWLR